MKKIAILVFLFFGVNLVLAEPNLKQATNEVCKCLEKPYEVVNQSLAKINKAQASGDFSEILAAQGSMMEVMSASTKCFDALPDKYPEINKSKELQDKVMNMAEKQCPNPASKFSVQN